MSFIIFIGNTNVSEAKGRSRKYAADAASAEGPKPVPAPSKETDIKYEYDKDGKLKKSSGEVSSIGQKTAIILYTSKGPQILSSDLQKYVKVKYSYDNQGRLTGATGSGEFNIDDGFGNKTGGTIFQKYSIMNGKAKLTENKIDTKVFNTDGSSTKQNVVVQYHYDNAGKLTTASGFGTSSSDDGFGNATKADIKQDYLVINGQAQERLARRESTTQNVDGSKEAAALNVTYEYDSSGRLKDAEGSGKYQKDDGFGNVTTGKITQDYQVINGQAKLVNTQTDSETASSDQKKQEVTTTYKYDEKEKLKDKVSEDKAPALRVFMLQVRRPSSGKIVSLNDKIHCGLTKCYAEYQEGETVVLKAVPDPESQLEERWGDCAGHEQTCEFKMDGPKSVGVTFSLAKQQIKKEPLEAGREKIEPAKTEEQREPASTEGEGEQICNPSIPKYQQQGCVEPSGEQQKRSPYDGLPCPEEEVPNYSKIGCIP